MRVAILSESEDDEEAIRILIDGILGRSTERITNRELRTRGWPYLRNILPNMLKYFHYQTDAEALVIVIDSDDSLVHQPSHNPLNAASQECRLCQLLAIVSYTQMHLRSLANRPAIKVAVGLAVPAIEAWYRCGRDPHVTEATWIQAQNQRQYPYTRNALKIAVYGTDRPSRALKTSRASEEAHRLVQDLPRLNQWFPNGFGSLTDAIHSW
jgi:hypothetical protein